MDDFRGAHPHYSEGRPASQELVTPEMIAAGMAVCAAKGVAVSDAVLTEIFREMLAAM